MKYCTKCGAKLYDDDSFCINCGYKASQIQAQEETTNSFSDEEKTINSISEKKIPTAQKNQKSNKAHVYPIIFGIVLILIGLLIPVPGGALTTYESLDGDKTEYYIFDDTYSSIDEYVGGDAYNYIIGASLVAGKISGTMITKAIFVVGGALCLCLGITLMMLLKKKIIKTVIGGCTPDENYETNSTHHYSHII